MRSVAQYQVLNQLVEHYLSGSDPMVAGSTLRLLNPEIPSQQRAGLLRSLLPDDAKMTGREPDMDFWEPTLEGLLASNSAPFATFWIDQALQLISEKARSEGAFHQYYWRELRDQARAGGHACDDSLVGKVALVIRTAGLEVRASKAAPPDYWYWTRPENFEQIVDLGSTQALLDFRRRQNPTSEPASQSPPPLTRPPLLAFERLLATALEGGVPTKALVERLDAIVASLPESLAVGGKAVLEVLRVNDASSVRQKQALSKMVPWVRRVHCLHSFANARSPANRDYLTFLRVMLKIDGELVNGQTISLASVGKRARLSEEIVDLCAARALDEGLAHVSDTEPQLYAVQVHDEEAQEELDRLESSRTVMLAYKDEAVDRRPQKRRFDVAIITIRDDEFEAVLEAFPKQDNPDRIVGTESQRHYNLRIADAGDGKCYKVAIVRLVHPGNGEGQTAARDCIEELDPALILVVGIAGAPPKNDLTLGDVVLSTHVHDFTVHARLPDGANEYSIGGGPMADAVARGVANLKARKADLGEWWAGLPDRPGVGHDVDTNYTGDDEDWNRTIRNSLEHHFVRRVRRAPLFIGGPLGASDALVKDPEILKAWLNAVRSLYAVDMESCGVYRAARERTAMLAIRGISDIVGFKRDEDWTLYACHSAAQMARAYLRTTPVPSGDLRWTEEASDDVAPVSSAQSQLAVRPHSVPDARVAVWELQVLPPPFPGTKSALYSALEDAIVTYDLHNFGRMARWPLAVKAGAAVVLCDGSTQWTMSYEQATNCRGIERLTIHNAGAVTFQRSMFLNTENAIVDLGALARDTVLFTAFTRRYAWKLGMTGNVEVRISLTAARGAHAIFHDTPTCATEPGTASLTSATVDGRDHIATLDYLSRTKLVDVALRLLDRVANEFLLEPSSLVPSSLRGFVSISRPSLERLAELLLGKPPGRELFTVDRDTA